MVGSSINLSDLQSGSFTGYVGSQGVIGYTGSKGEFGGAAFEYNYSNTTSAGDPGSGNLRFNSLDLSTANTLYIDFLDLASANSYNYLLVIDDSTSGVKGTFKIEDKANTQNFAFFSITGSHTNPGDYFQVPVAWINGVTSFTNGLDTVTTFVRTGDKGDIGYTGSKGDIGYTGSKGTDGTIGYNGSVGYTGSQGDIGYTGSAGAVSSDTQVIYNSSGTLVGNSTLTFSASSNNLTVANSFIAAQHTTGSIGTGTGGLVANVTTLFVGNNTVNTLITSAGLTVNGATIANNSGVYAATVNAASHTVGTSFTANATLVNAAAVNVTGQVNTATFYAATSANVGTVFTVNSTALAASANLAMANNHIVSPTLKAYSEFAVTNTNVTSTFTVDLSVSNIFNVTLTGNTTFTFSNPATSGTTSNFLLAIKQGGSGSYTATWPASVKFPNNSTPSLTTTVGKFDIFNFITFDNGTSYFGSLSLANL
jgi:hypothetical protein